MSLITRIGARVIAHYTRRQPDFVIGGAERPYLLRWYVTPWRGWFRAIPEADRSWWQESIVWITRWLPNIYLHKFLRSDDDRALHDHPWLFNASILLQGEYAEHTIAAGGVHQRRLLSAGDIRVRIGASPHRVELLPACWSTPERLAPCWTLFVTGPFVREWGFHCPRGWIHWERFTDPSDAGGAGAGCDGEVSRG